MIDKALVEYNIDLNNSFYIGDSYSDYLLAQKFGLDFYGIKGRNSDSIFKYQNLYSVIKKRNR